MQLADLLAILISLAALFSYINHRYLHLPPTIGLMLLSLAMSLLLTLAPPLGLGVEETIRQVIGRIDFDETLLHGMLSLLLFAGALHLDLQDLSQQKWVILLLATLSVVGSTFLVGLMAYWVFNALGLGLPLVHCLLFGALISPTDPIAVLGILKTVGAPKTLEVQIAGESLFNDGVAVVVFLVILNIAGGGGEFDPWQALGLFAKEALGGALFGLVAGAAAYWLLKSVDNYRVEILITLALVMGGFSLAAAWHLSGPIAVVVAGLLIGNQGRLLAMSEQTRQRLDMFWELVDEILNAVLFVLIGLEVLVLTFQKTYLAAGLVMIPLVVLARLVCVGLPISALRRVRPFRPHLVKILTWAGLRGGISVALALSLPPGPQRETILAVTYCVVVFSIVVQGTTIGKLIRFSLKHSEGA